MALACENSYFRLDKKKESKLRFRQKQELNSHNHTCDKNQDNFFIAYFKRFCYSYSRATKNIKVMIDHYNSDVLHSSTKYLKSGIRALEFLTKK